MMAQPMKTLDLHYPVIQFLIIYDNVNLTMRYSEKTEIDLGERTKRGIIQIKVKSRPSLFQALGQ